MNIVSIPTYNEKNQTLNMIKMKKKISMAIALAFCCLSAMADGPGVIFLLNDGTRSAFSFESEPVMVMNSDSVTITTKSESSVSYQFANVNKFYFADDIATSVEAVKGTSSELVPIFSYRDGVITASGLASNANVRIVSIEGVSVYSTRASHDGCVSIDISHFPAGIYIVSSGRGVSFKLLKK